MAAKKTTNAKKPAPASENEAKTETKSKTEPKGSEGKQPGSKSKRKLSPREKVRKSQETVLRKMPAIVNKICERATAGNHTAAKFVFDFAGITEMQSPLDESASQESLAGVLLEKLNDGNAGPEGSDPSGTVK